MPLLEPLPLPCHRWLVQVIARVVRLRIHWKNTLQQLKEVGPGSVGVSLLTACFVGMAFTIQVPPCLPSRRAVEVASCQLRGASTLLARKTKEVPFIPYVCLPSCGCAVCARVCSPRPHSFCGRSACAGHDARAESGRDCHHHGWQGGELVCCRTRDHAGTQVCCSAGTTTEV